MASKDPFDRTSAPFSFGLKGFRTISLDLSKPLLPSTHLEPVISEAHLAARVAFGFDGIGFDGQQQKRQIIGAK